MRKRISTPPPAQFQTFRPSQLFRFFFQLGRWTEESFSAEFQTYTRGKLISSVTVNKWKNHDVIPSRYAGPLFKLIEDLVDPQIAAEWIQAFEIVWATHLARSTGTQEGNKEDFDHPQLSNSICDQHIRWIRSLYSDPLFGENFSTRDIYVPLQLIERQEKNLILYDNEDLLNLFKAADRTDWVCITGAAGAGKSMLALHLAQSLADKDILPIYLRGQHISDIEIDIRDKAQPVIDSFSAKSFIKHFRTSSRKTACLILDSVDEISGTPQDITKFLSDLRLEQNVCRAHGKTLLITTFSQLAGLDSIKRSQIIDISMHLEILGLDGRYRTDNNMDEFSMGEDMRPIWWNKYLVAIGRKLENTLPDFLCTEYADFQEFGSAPLWSYLICQTALQNEPDKSLLAHEAVNKFTYQENTNLVYRNILGYIRQNGTQGLAYERLPLYILSTLILDRFIELINSQGNADRFDEAANNWAEVSSQANHNPVLVDFCQKEVRLRYSELRDLKWTSALSLIKERLDTNLYSGSALEAVSLILDSASLLFFIWSCFNLEHYKRSNPHYALSEHSEDFNISTLRQIHQSNFLNFKTETLIEPRLGRETFLTPSLSALYLTGADLSQLSFSLGHMDSFSCEKSSFAMTHWSHVKISTSIFKKSAFQQALFQSCRWHDSDVYSCLVKGSTLQNSSFLTCRLKDIFFSQCHFDAVDFLSTTFEGVIFDRCVFTNCSFESKIENALIGGVEFRYCTFLSMKKSVLKFSEDRLTNCLIQTGSEAKKALTEKFL